MPLKEARSGKIKKSFVGTCAFAILFPLLVAQKFCCSVLLCFTLFCPTKLFSVLQRTRRSSSRNYIPHTTKRTTPFPFLQIAQQCDSNRGKKEQRASNRRNSQSFDIDSIVFFLGTNSTGGCFFQC